MPKVLITSVGSLVGHNILSALQPARDRLYVIGTETDPAVANNFRCDAAFLVPPTSEQDQFASRLSEIIRDEQVDLVLSGTDTDLPNLAALSATESRLPWQFEAGGATPNMVRKSAANDKPG